MCAQYTVVIVTGRIFQSVLGHVVILRKPGLEFVITQPRALVVEIAGTWVQIHTRSFVTHSRAQSTGIIPIGRNFHLVLKRVEIARNFDDDFAQIRSRVSEEKTVPHLGRILKRPHVSKLRVRYMEISRNGPSFPGVLARVEIVLDNGTEIVLVRPRCMAGTTVHLLALPSKL